MKQELLALLALPEKPEPLGRPVLLELLEPPAKLVLLV